MEQEMKWHNFLIYFALWAGGIVNIIGGLGLMARASQVYYGGGTLAMIGIVMIAYGIFSIYVRFRLAGYYTNGPTLLIASYVINAIVSLFTSGFTGLIASVIMIAVNYVYYNKRSSLFVN